MAQPQQKPAWPYSTEINYYQQPSYNPPYSTPVRCNETCCQTVKYPAPRRPYHDLQYSQQQENSKPIYPLKQLTPNYMPVNHYWPSVNCPQYPPIHGPVIQPNHTKEYYNYNRYRFHPYNNSGIQNSVRPLKNPCPKNQTSKKAQQLDVRQFLATWQEKDEEINEHSDNGIQKESGQFYPTADTFQPLDYTIRNGTNIIVGLENKFRDSEICSQKYYGSCNDFCPTGLQRVNYNGHSSKNFPELNSFQVKQHNNTLDTRQHINDINQSYSNLINLEPSSSIPKPEFEPAKQFKHYNKSWMGASCERRIEKISNPNISYNESPKNVELSHIENFNMNRECRVNSGKFPVGNNTVESNFDDFKVISEKYTLTVCLETDELFDDINKKKDERQKLVVHPLRHDDYKEPDLSNPKLGIPEFPIKPILQNILADNENSSIPDSTVVQSTVPHTSQWGEAHLDLQNSKDNMERINKRTQNIARGINSPKYLLGLNPDEICDYSPTANNNNDTFNSKHNELLGYKENFLSNESICLGNQESSDSSKSKSVIDTYICTGNNSKTISNNVMSFNDFDSRGNLNTFDCCEDKSNLSSHNYHKSSAIVSLSSDEIDVSIASCGDINVTSGNQPTEVENSSSCGNSSQTAYNGLSNCKSVIDSDKDIFLKTNNNFTNRDTENELDNGSFGLSEKSELSPSKIKMESLVLDAPSFNNDLSSGIAKKIVSISQKSTSDFIVGTNPALNGNLNPTNLEQEFPNLQNAPSQLSTSPSQEHICDRMEDSVKHSSKELIHANEIKSALESIAYFYEDVNNSESSEDSFLNLHSDFVEGGVKCVAENRKIKYPPKDLNTTHGTDQLSDFEELCNKTSNHCDNKLYNCNLCKQYNKINSHYNKNCSPKMLIWENKYERYQNNNLNSQVSNVDKHTMQKQTSGEDVGNKMSIPDSNSIVPAIANGTKSEKMTLMLHNNSNIKIKCSRFKSVVRSAKLYAAEKIVLKYRNLRCRLHSKKKVLVNQEVHKNLCGPDTEKLSENGDTCTKIDLPQENKVQVRDNVLIILGSILDTQSKSGDHKGIVDAELCNINSNCNYPCYTKNEGISLSQNNKINEDINDNIVKGVHNCSYVEEEVKAVSESVNLKCSLSWDKIFNIKGQKSQTELNLGPAKVELRLGPHKGQWRIIDNCKDTHSQVLKVKRLIMQRKTLPKERVPKVIIKKTGGEEYKSFIKESELQPAVMLERCSQLDELAKEAVHAFKFKCKSCTISFLSQEKLEEHHCKKEAHHCLLCQRSFSSLSSFCLHEETRSHKHLEIIQKNAAHNIYKLLTGFECPLLPPLTTADRDHLNWKPDYPGYMHYYHHSTI